MFHATIPSEFVDRITTLAAAVGHVGLKLSSSRPVASSGLLEEVIWPFVRRVGAATVVCAKKDLQAHPLLQEILSPDGLGFRLRIDEACAQRFKGFWTGELFSSDRTLAMPLSLAQIEGEPLIAQGADPFVMQNLVSFMGKRGEKAVANLIADARNGVVCALVGPPNEVLVFGLPNVLRQLVPLFFSRCHFTAQYQSYARGAFVPIEDVLRQLRSKRA